MPRGSYDCSGIAKGAPGAEVAERAKHKRPGGATPRAITPEDQRMMDAEDLNATPRASRMQNQQMPGHFVRSDGFASSHMMNSMTEAAQYYVSYAAPANPNTSSFFQSQLPNDNFPGSSFSHQSFPQGNFSQINFSQGNFRQGGFPQRSFSSISQSNFSQNSFAPNNFSDSGFPQSNLAQNSFTQGNLHQASFPQTHTHSSFAQNSFVQNNVPQNSFIQGNIRQASFPQTQCNFAQNNLVQSSFSGHMPAAPGYNQAWGVRNVATNNPWNGHAHPGQVFENPTDNFIAQGSDPALQERHANMGQPRR
ncbi:Fc.00g018420.m01.CDS01 [Cosmosporella sp. VM-42]